MKFNQTFITSRVNVSEDEILNVYNRTQREFASKPKRALEALSVQILPGMTLEEKNAVSKNSQSIVRNQRGNLDGRIGWRHWILEPTSVGTVLWAPSQ